MKIDWCKQQKKGIELVEPNDNLSDQYSREAENTLQFIEGKEDKWDVIKAYYACYNALYSILMKVGIKCEIHDCTLELMKILNGFDDNDYLFLSLLKVQRIKAQYYLKDEKLRNLPEVKSFIFKCKEILEDLDIEEIRGKLNDQKR